MSRCLVVGCRQRQKGKHCDGRFCSRTPVGVCPHLQAEIKKYKRLTPQDSAEIIAEIVRQLEIVRPRTYREPPSPGAGVIARAGEAAVCLMQRRHHHGLKIFDRRDVRQIDDEEVRRHMEEKLKRRLMKLAHAVLAAGRTS